MIAILAALHSEFADLMSDIKVVARFTQGGCAIVQGSYLGKELLLAETGVGRHGAEMAASYATSSYKLQCMVSVGFAGGLEPSVKVGDIVVYNAVYRANGHTETDAGGPLYSPCHSDLVHLAAQTAAANGFRVIQGNGITVPAIVADACDKARLAAIFPVQAADMESYWIAQTASQHGIPFVTVRAVSDAAGDILPRLERMGQSGGSWRWQRALPYLASHPAELARLFSLVANVRRARRSLTCYMKNFIPQI